MNEIASAAVSDPAPESTGDKPAETKKKEEGSFLAFLVKLVIAVILFRTLLFTSFSIPSESMMPRLLVGDYLFASKWSYGYSGASLPIDWNRGTGTGRIFERLPERGDVIIFKHPIDRVDYVKRVIGLPGDTVQMINGVLHLNGEPVKKERIGDYLLPTSVDGHCRQGRTERLPEGAFVCRYPQFRETLPSGVTYNVLDFGLVGISEAGIDPDNTEPVIVPEGHLFMMGDNRDNSLDSRFPSVAGKGVGLVPVENLVGRASFMFFSTDGSADWVKPWTWFSAARWDRIGHAI